MKRHLAITTVMVLCSVFFFVVVCAADPATPTRPTKGAWSGTSTVVGYCTNGVLVAANGTGVSTHFGKSTWVAETVCMAANPLDPSTLSSTGDATITAANGDQIYMSTFFQLFDFGNPSNAGTWSQNITITGGTGRFEGATGVVTSFGDWVGISNDPPTLFWSGTHEGSITY